MTVQRLRPTTEQPPPELAGVTHELEYITPESAEEYLTGRTHNRKVHDRQVHKFERLLQTGDFKTTPQGLIFSKDGRLLDGQHRLYAIVNSGISAWMWVARGCPDAVQLYLDQGLIRTVLEVMQLEDKNTNATDYRIAVSRRMCMGVRNSVVMTLHDTMAFCREHDRALTFALEAGFQGKRPRYVAPAGVAAVIARGFYHEDPARLIEFGNVMVGIRSSEGDVDSGARLLREWLLSGSPMYGSVRVSRELLVYMKAQRGLTAFLEREKIKILYPLQEEKWVLPGETRRPTKRGGPIVERTPQPRRP